MDDERPGDAALAPLAPGECLRLAHDGLIVDVAPAAGGRIARIARNGVEWLIGYSATNRTAIGWGCYPMLPWAGRLRDGRFELAGREYRLPRNLGAHAIHGIAFALPWSVEQHTATQIELSLALPTDERWPFGGTAHQRLRVEADALQLHLSVTAAARTMPCVIGWHPWFRKPERLDFQPQGCYRRDAVGIAVGPLADPPPPPWDDCFLNTRPVRLSFGGQRLQLSSDCSHWVVYDETAHATCVEPQSGPPDAFNIAPCVLAPRQTLTAHFRLEWG